MDLCNWSCNVRLGTRSSFACLQVDCGQFNFVWSCLSSQVEARERLVKLSVPNNVSKFRAGRDGGPGTTSHTSIKDSADPSGLPAVPSVDGVLFNMNGSPDESAFGRKRLKVLERGHQVV